MGSLEPAGQPFWVVWRVLGHQYGPGQRDTFASSYAIHSKHALHASRSKPSAVFTPRKPHCKNLAVKPAQRFAMRSEVKGEAEGRRTFAQHSKPLRWLDREVLAVWFSGGEYCGRFASRSVESVLAMYCIAACACAALARAVLMPENTPNHAKPPQNGWPAGSKLPKHSPGTPTTPDSRCKRATALLCGATSRRRPQAGGQSRSTAALWPACTASLGW